MKFNPFPKDRIWPGNCAWTGNNAKTGARNKWSLMAGWGTWKRNRVIAHMGWESSPSISRWSYTVRQIQQQVCDFMSKLPQSTPNDFIPFLQRYPLLGLSHTIHKNVQISFIMQTAKPRVTENQLSVLTVALNPHCLNPTQSPAAA